MYSKMTTFSEEAPKPRLCHIKKWKDWNGYGFKLQVERRKYGYFIGRVDSNSPAALSGIKVGDRLIEVNGVKITDETLEQVMMGIKFDQNGVSLLLLDLDADKYYKDRKLVVTGEMSNVLVITCPDTSKHTGTVVEEGGSAYLITDTSDVYEAIPDVSTPVKTSRPLPPIPASFDVQNGKYFFNSNSIRCCTTFVLHPHLQSMHDIAACILTTHKYKNIMSILTSLHGFTLAMQSCYCHIVSSPTTYLQLR